MYVHVSTAGEIGKRNARGGIDVRRVRRSACQQAAMSSARVSGLLDAYSLVSGRTPVSFRFPRHRPQRRPKRDRERSDIWVRSSMPSRWTLAAARRSRAGTRCRRPIFAACASSATIDMRGAVQRMAGCGVTPAQPASKDVSSATCRFGVGPVHRAVTCAAKSASALRGSGAGPAISCRWPLRERGAGRRRAGRGGRRAGCWGWSARGRSATRFASNGRLRCCDGCRAWRRHRHAIRPW